VLSDTHDIAALFKKDGSIRWAQSLAVSDPRDATRDITPALYGPILAGNAVLVLDAKGMMTAFKPQDGAILGTYSLASGTVTAPLITNGALYIITRDARLHRYN
jgi:outer membrane protein assembly factor BamB